MIGVFCTSAFFSWLSSHQKKSTIDGVRQITIAHGLPISHPVHLGLEELKRKAEELSGGKLRFAIFPGGQLGSESQCLEKTQVGTLDLTKVSAAPVSNFVPVFKIFSLPYLFHNEEQCWKVLDGEIGKEMLDALATRGDGTPSGLHGLGYFDSGSRSFYAVKPINKLEDIRGRKFRVMNDAVAMDMVQAMGGAPTPIDYGELYTALKQGAVDGAENNPPSFLTSGHFEVCKHYLLNHHSRVPDVIIISSKLWAQLDGQERQWLEQAVAHAESFQRELWKAETVRSLDELRKHGVVITEPDLAPFREVSKSVYHKHSSSRIRDLVDRIQATR